MAKPHFLRLFIYTVLTFILRTAVAGGNCSWVPVDEAACMVATGRGSELELDSEINRRILASSEYISYDALQGNNVPCSRRGASYYNCQPDAEANPYTRSCTAVTRCGRG
ncbi:hypothetical protein CASFOL_029571 [Castilleja foliolosa]|uniref:Rapid alkalinization factor n=1 Tax=Castilleja foliolosa TaxID=1961234 RepID=A0ABD3C8Y3_9LAMI